MIFDSTPYLNDTINGDKFIQNNYWNDRETKLNLENPVVFCKTDYLNELFERLEKQSREFVLVTHNSDHGPELYKYPRNVKTWFAQNAKSIKYVPIPIGLERPGIANSGNIQDFLDVENTNPNFKKSGLLYVNFSDGTHSSRPVIKEHLRKFNWANIQDSRVSFKTYLSEVRSHYFCMSPPGNGSDCHRTWEALYMGTVPVCADNYHNREFSKVLPMLLYDAPEDVNLEFLIEGLLTIKQGLDAYDLSALTSKYWIDKINSALEDI